jgi:hypothetical protein
VECCLDACGKLDKLGLLNEDVAGAATVQQKGIVEEDSEDDSFFDLTRQKGVVDSSTAETFESLSKKRTFYQTQINQLETELDDLKAKQNGAGDGDGDEDDDLDAYLNTLSSGLAKEEQVSLESQLAQYISVFYVE